MFSIVPLTKIILMIVISLWALIIQSTLFLGLIVVIEIILLAMQKKLGQMFKTIVSLVGFAIMLGIFQYILGVKLETAIIIGLRMIIMPLIFIFILVTTRLQDLTASMVVQCRIPYEYAFMLTSALRFIPEFIAESKNVQEAQACRGYNISGNPLKKLYSYLTVIQPLVLRAITRSETMAMSMELRGFGSAKRSFFADITLKPIDYMVIVTSIIFTVLIAIAEKYLLV